MNFEDGSEVVEILPAGAPTAFAIALKSIIGWPLLWSVLRVER